MTISDPFNKEIYLALSYFSINYSFFDSRPICIKKTQTH
jgi:hypothetical protein